MPTDVGPVVLGVPDEPTDALLRVATDQARSRGAGLLLVRVDVHPGDRQLLSTTADRVRALGPGLPVNEEFVAGDVFPELLERTDEASALVLGGDALGDDSISAWYLGRSSCPVVVVTPDGRVFGRPQRSRV